VRPALLVALSHRSAPALQRVHRCSGSVLNCALMHRERVLRNSFAAPAVFLVLEPQF
jgi:hypothetical protein